MKERNMKLCTAMSRRQMLRVTGVALSGAFLAACGATPTPTKAPAPAPAQPTATKVPEPAKPPQPVELRIGWWGSQTRHDRTIKVIEMFMQKNPNVKIVYEFTGWADYWVRMATQAAGGNLPDIMQQDYAYIEEWANKKLIVSLEPFVADGTLNFKNVPEASLKGGRIKNDLVAVNLGNNSMDIVVDLDAFKKAGVSVPSEQWTWADYETITLALREKLGIWGGQTVSNEQFWKSLYLGLGQWSYSVDGTQLGYTDDKPFIDFLNMQLRLQKAKAIPTREEEVAAKWTTETDPLVSGQTCMGGSNWSNILVATWTAAGETRNFRLWPLPRPVGGKSENYYKPSMFWSMTAHSKWPKQAAMFIDFFTNSVEANEILFAERGVPISTVVRDALKPKLGKAQLEAFEYLARLEKDITPVPPPDPVGATDIISNIWWPQIMEPVLYGKLEPAKAAALLRTEANAILAKNKK